MVGIKNKFSQIERPLHNSKPREMRASSSSSSRKRGRVHRRSEWRELQPVDVVQLVAKGVQVKIKAVDKKRNATILSLGDPENYELIDCKINCETGKKYQAVITSGIRVIIHALGYDWLFQTEARIVNPSNSKVEMFYRFEVTGQDLSEKLRALEFTYEENCAHAFKESYYKVIGDTTKVDPRKRKQVESAGRAFSTCFEEKMQAIIRQHCRDALSLETGIDDKLSKLNVKTIEAIQQGDTSDPTQSLQDDNESHAQKKPKTEPPTDNDFYNSDTQSICSDLFNSEISDIFNLPDVDLFEFTQQGGTSYPITPIQFTQSPQDDNESRVQKKSKTEQSTNPNPNPDNDSFESDDEYFSNLSNHGQSTDTLLIELESFDN